jgi:hypothetical protein
MNLISSGGCIIENNCQIGQFMLFLGNDGNSKMERIVFQSIHKERKF